MKKFDITFLTDSRYVNPEEINPYIQNILDEDVLVIQALEERGLSVNRVDWADPNYDWQSVKFALFRTTWDYFDRIDEFMTWLNATKDKVKFINPIELILWNLDKHYLQDLAEKGVNITDTIFIEPGDKTALSKVFHAAQFTDAILKPAISGSARHTYKLSENNLADHEAIFQELIAQESMLLQPFQYSVLEKGEVALMFFGGKYSHAVLKVAKPSEFRVQSEFGGTIHNYSPSANEIKLAEKALQVCDPTPIYARIDIIDDNNGKPAVSELEIIEPELWFRLHPPSATTMAEAIITHIAKEGQTT